MAICNFSKIYKPLFYEEGRYFDLLGGRGRGGSYAGTAYFLHLITQKAYFRGCFLRQTLGDVRGSLFQDFKDRITEVEELNESVKLSDFDINESLMSIVYRPTKNMIISKGVTKTSDRTAKLKSLAGVTHVLIEEADEVGEFDFDQLDLSLRTVKVKGGVRVLRIFNPPHKTHWIWRDYNLVEATKEDFFNRAPEKMDEYFKVSPKQSSSVVAMFSTYHDNGVNLDKTSVLKLESFFASKPDYYYTVVLGLVSEGQKGRVFSRWKPITNAGFNEIDAKSIFGLDFGLASPAGLIEAKFVKNNIYLRQQNYKPLTNKEIAIKLCDLGLTNQVIVADSAEPNSIAKLRRGWSLDELSDMHKTIFEDDKKIKSKYKLLTQGFNIYPATKGQGSVNAGISLVQDMNVFVTEDSSDLWNEYREYKWALDKNKNPTDDPIDQFNHLIDPIRYVAKDRGKYY